MTNSRARFAFIVFALAACGKVAQPPGGDDDPSTDGSIVDPPGVVSVVSTSPADDAIGVAADATITIAFSKPMDQATVQGAWQSLDLAPATVTFAWDAAGTTLTVTPNAPLELARGTGLDPSTVTARAYAYAIGTGARALDGSTLASLFQVRFTTLRRLDVELAAVGSLTRTMRADGLVFGETAVTMTVGDTTTNLQTKTFVTFTLPRLPDGATVDEATLEGSQSSVNGTPYALGDLRALHTAASVIDDAAFTGAPLAVAGDLSTTETTGAKRLAVTAQLSDDIANSAARGQRTQYRLEFATAGSANATADEARFSRSGFGLTVAYVIP